MTVDYYNGRWIRVELLDTELTAYRYSSWRGLRRDARGLWAFWPWRGSLG